jgi:alkylation response protein AidB-like acyl-CoA dehydrogenase
MDFQLTDEQAALIAALQDILSDHAELPQSDRLRSHYFDWRLQRILEENGYLSAGRELGSLEAALVVMEVARVPAVVELGATVLVAPKLLAAEEVQTPVALLSGRDLSLAHRNLPIARTALIDLGSDVAVLTIAKENVTPVESVLAYPYGRFVHVPDISRARCLCGQGALLRQWWRVALAAEFAGAAQAAITYTLNHVKQRHVFGHPVGAFQAVQHRLVQCHIAVCGIRDLVLQAAWSGERYDADVAACNAQQHTKKLLVDLHQFTGAMGVTNEFLLHFWTYRLRALQHEVGGTVGAALDIARRRWQSGPPPPSVGSVVKPTADAEAR